MCVHTCGGLVPNKADDDGDGATSPQLNIEEALFQTKLTARRHPLIDKASRRQRRRHTYMFVMLAIIMMKEEKKIKEKKIKEQKRKQNISESYV